MAATSDPQPARAAYARIRSQPESYFAPPQDATPAALGADESRRTVLLGAYLFLATCVFVLGRTVRDAFFLSHYQARVGTLLPFMFIAYGAASSMFALVYVRFVTRIRRDRFIVASCLCAAGAYLAVRVAAQTSPPWLYAALYVGSEIVGNLTLVQFWSVANAVHDARSARRVFGLIGLGRIAGLVVCGLGTSNLVAWIGTENLLLVLVALLFAMAVLVRWLAHEYPIAGSIERSVRTRSIVSPLRTPYVRILAAITIVGFVAVNIGDFQFKAAARIVYPQRDAIAHFMAQYYAVLGLVALVLQPWGTRWILRRFGVAGGMAAMPIAYLLANVGLLLVPSLGLATTVKIADNAFQFTVFEATIQLLYFPLAVGARDGIRTFLEAVAKPLGYGIAGIAVLLLRGWERPDSLGAIARESWFVVRIVVGWLAMTPMLRRRYLDSLERSLARRDVETGFGLTNDANTRALLTRTATTAPSRPAIYALEQLAALDPPSARETIAALLERPDPAVRQAAIRAASGLRAHEHSDAICARLEDADESVAATAAETYALLAGEECLPVLTRHVADPRAAVQDAALAGLLRSGGLEGVLVAGRIVEEWLASSEPSLRTRAARLLARPGIPGLSRIVRRLLQDPDAGVRREALVAAGSVGDPAACAAVLDALRSRSERDAAARALVQIGSASITLAERALVDETMPWDARLALPRVLAEIRTPAAYAALLRHIDDSDEWIRQKVLASASRARAAANYSPLPYAATEPRMIREVASVTRLRTQYLPARAFIALPLLDRWTLERLRKGLIRVLRLAELSYPARQVAVVRETIFSKDTARRARAIEIVENMLGIAVRQRFVEELDAWFALKSSPLSPSSSPGNAEAFVQQLVSLRDPFARVIGLDAAQYRGIEIAPATVIKLTDDPDPAVREMAALVIATFAPPGARDVLNRMRGDDDLRVRTYAEYAFATGRTGMEPWDDMYTTLEKVLFLQRIPLFADVPPEHLVALARSADVERRTPGEVVFRRGDPGDALYFVIDGRVEILRDGRQSTSLGDGEVFGEMSVLDASPRSDSVEVKEDTTLMRIAQEDFYEVLHGTAELAQGVIHVLVRRLRAATSGTT